MQKKGLLLVAVLWISLGLFAQNINRAAFYQAFSSNNMQVLSAQMVEIKKINSAESLAFEGALRMKMSGFAKGIANKLSNFKAGHYLLDNAIDKDTGNAEYRLLRLMIQEHAPKILKYHHNMEADSKLIKGNFKTLSQPLQKIILDYCSQSNTLKATDL